MQETMSKPNYEPRVAASMSALFANPEVSYYLERVGASRYKPDMAAVEELLPLGQIKLVDYFMVRATELDHLRQIMELLDFAGEDERERLSRSFINRLAANALSGIMSSSEVGRIFEWYRKAWSEYWPEEMMNHLMRKVLAPATAPQNMPDYKLLNLETACHMSGIARTEGQSVVIVMGTFDFHSGHANLLTAARYLAGQGLVFAFVTSDREASQTRPGETNILNFNERCAAVASHMGVDYCVELPWEDKYADANTFDEHMRSLHCDIGANFRLVGELDERSKSIRSQCNQAGTILVYRDEKRIEKLSSTALRHKLNQSG